MPFLIASYINFFIKTPFSRAGLSDTMVFFFKNKH